MTASPFVAGEPCGRQPVILHCHGCGDEWSIGYLPETLDRLIVMLEHTSCPGCGVTDNVRLGSRCDLVAERLRK